MSEAERARMMALHELGLDRETWPNEAIGIALGIVYEEAAARKRWKRNALMWFSFSVILAGCLVASNAAWWALRCS